MEENAKELRALLEAPFPEEKVQQKVKDGRELDFVAWHDYVTRLNDLTFGDWSSEITDITQTTAPDDEGKRVDILLVSVAVTIAGATHTNLGEADASKRSWGGAFAEAFSQAFRRACAMHGLGLYLYKDGAPPTPVTPSQAGLLMQVARSSAITNEEREGIKTRLDTRRVHRGNFMSVLESLKGLIQDRKSEEEDDEEDEEESG